MTTVCVLLFIPYDLAVTRTAFTTTNGYCSMIFLNDGASVKIFFVLAIILFILDLTVFVVGVALYFKVSKEFCNFKSTDVRVSLMLMATAGLDGYSLVLNILLTESSK